MTYLRFALVIALASCSKAQPADKRPARTADISTLFAGTTVTMPAELEAKVGMTADEYKVATHDAIKTWSSSPSVEIASYSYSWSKEPIERIKSIDLYTDPAVDLVPIVTKKWGAPIADGPDVYWENATTKLRATITLAYNNRIEFEQR